MFTAEFLREMLSYDPLTGQWIWLKSPGRRVRARTVAGSIHAAEGYLIIQLKNRGHKAHRLAWLYMTGEWPKHQIDHKNGNRADNRWCNLREATQTENRRNAKRQKNNTSGFKGVNWVKRRNRWQARIMVNNESIGLGLHRTKESAYAAYCDAAVRLHGEFSRLQ